LELVEVAEGFDYQTLHGSHKAVTLPSPAAGAALTYTVPGSVQWEILSLSFTYTASGNAASRVPFVRFLDQSGTAFCDVATPYKLVASDVSRVTFGVGVVQFGADSAARIGAGIPAMRLEDGLRVQVSATLIDGSDTITLARLFVRQWDVRE
jgi:hypothetical protein